MQIDKCTQAFQTNNYSPDEHTKIKVKINATSQTTIFEKGLIYSDGSCQGEHYRLNGKLRSGILLEKLFDVVYGTMYLHSTRMTSNSLKITFSEVDREKTPTILISNRETDMLHLTKLNTVAKCGKLLFATNFPDILLSSQVIPTALLQQKLN